LSHATYEWVYVAVVTALLIFIGAEAWNVEHTLEFAPPESKTIKVIGQQWFWTFEHENGQQEVGELHVTQGVPYRFEIVSKDVIHDFNVPDFTILMDAVPGRVNTLWNVFDVPGQYLIQCREYCGLLHYNMRAKLFVLPTAAENSFESNQTQAAGAGGATGSANSATTAASSSGGSSAASVSGPVGGTLTILAGANVQGNPSYDPTPMTVKKGDAIQVVNKDTTPHTATSGKGAEDPNASKMFDTNIINAGASAKISTASLNAGEYPFFCKIHPYMTGNLKVQ
jgi:cytochrome c oxidase subunit II